MANDRGSYLLETSLTFLFGTAAGFVLGVIFAPSSGEETRKKIKEVTAKTGEKAKESYGKISKEAEKGIKVIKEKTHEGIDSVKGFIEKKKEEIMKKFPHKTAQVKRRE